MLCSQAIFDPLPSDVRAFAIADIAEPRSDVYSSSIPLLLVAETFSQDLLDSSCLP